MRPRYVAIVYAMNYFLTKWVEFNILIVFFILFPENLPILVNDSLEFPGVSISATPPGAQSPAVCDIAFFAVQEIGKFF